LEAIQVWVASGTVCGEAHVQNIGWQPRVCTTGGTIQIGTTGQSLRMEAALFFVV